MSRLVVRLAGAEGQQGTLEPKDRCIWVAPRNLALLAAIAGGIYLLFDRAAYTGFTYDEAFDFEIARGVLSRATSILDTRLEPTQGRFSHLLSIPLMAWLGADLFSFKLTSIVLTLASAVALWAFLRLHCSVTASLAGVALFLTNNYVLASARAGGTAGDAAVVLTTFLLFISCERWVARRRFWPWGFWSGAFLGLAVAAKWMSGVYLAAPCGVLLWGCKRQNVVARLAQLLLLVALVAVFAVAGSPTFLNGPQFVRDALASSMKFESFPEYRYFGQWWHGAPWFYVPVLLWVKLTEPLFLAGLAGFAYFAWRWLAHGERHRVVGLAALFLVLSFLPAHRSFQNANYYLPVVGPVLCVVCLLLDRLLYTERRGMNRAAYLALLGALAYSLALDTYLAPDYLQGGKQYGDRFLGEFYGPAVLHCQGGPAVLETLNRLNGSGLAAYQVDHCDLPLRMSAAYGPVKYAHSLVLYPWRRPPERPFFLLVPKIARVLPHSSAQRFRLTQDRYALLKKTCREEAHGFDTYQIFFCE